MALNKWNRVRVSRADLAVVRIRKGIESGLVTVGLKTYLICYRSLIAKLAKFYFFNAACYRSLSPLSPLSPKGPSMHHLKYLFAYLAAQEKETRRAVEAASPAVHR